MYSLCDPGATSRGDADDGSSIKRNRPIWTMDGHLLGKANGKCGLIRVVINTLDLCKILMPRVTREPRPGHNAENAVCRGARGHTERARGTAGTAGPDPHPTDQTHHTRTTQRAPAARDLPPIRFHSTVTSSAAPALPPHGAAWSTHGPARRRRGSSTRYASSMCIGRGPIVALAEPTGNRDPMHPHLTSELLRPRPAVGSSDAAPAAVAGRWPP